MARERLHHLPVVENDHLAGMLSASDLIGRDAPDAGRQRVGAVMQRQTESLGRDSTLLEAATRLVAGDFHALPVTDPSGRVIGIVTSTDLVRLLLGQLAPAAPQGAPAAPSPTLLADLEQVRRAAELYLRSGHGEHEHGALVRALDKAREHAGAGLPPGRL
jgi:hypothetical protein